MWRVVLALAACNAPSSRPAPVPVAHAILPDVPFDRLDAAQRAQFMTERVLPAMAPTFRGHGTALTCETCHGPPVDGTYRMPNPALGKLGDDLTRWKREDLEWMSREVTPAMANLLGRGEPTFTCSACHVVDP